MSEPIDLLIDKIQEMMAECTVANESFGYAIYMEQAHKRATLNAVLIEARRIKEGK